METQRYLPIIEKLIEETGAHESNMLSDCLLRVVTYELLFGKGLGGRDAGSFRKGIRPYQRKMKDALKKLKEDMGASNGKELLEKFGLQAKEGFFYNKLKGCEDSRTKKHLMPLEGGSDLVRGKDAKAISSLMDEYITSLQPWQFMSDLHLPDVLVFSPATPLFKHHLTLDKKIILMDKASCIPARVLSPPRDSHVVDACAAPGNKTNHLSCIMQNTGKVFAFDLDQKRTETLKAMVEKSGSTNVEAQCADFLEIDPTDPKYAKVTHILTDPSCSGSGIVSRKDHLTGETTSRTRLKLLRGLQLRILNHAMLFPAVERVIYSTCSVHREENEEVVWRILEANPEFDLETVLPSWHHRPTKASSRNEEGEDQNEEEYYETDVNYSHLREKLDEEITRKCLRASFNVDKTNGFFVALFKKSRNFSNETRQGEGEHTVGEDETQEGEVEGNCKDDEYAEVEQVKEDRSKLMDASEHGLDATTKSKKRRFSGSAEEDSSLIKGENSLKKKKKKRKKDKTRDQSILNEDDFGDVKQFDHSLEDAKVTLTSDDADNDVDVKADVVVRDKEEEATRFD
ncbi:putative methyltransferase NSUN5-like [Apostichopus japonicus]|uniref:Putative methyltransferase NSUN5-like n=1 Tax=Stichopus japonicus TaxID=307972 RepID=A0A2G8LF53_STIJA|nr:putative methyltransferase NSUN5-like [Apostichopus japonicus]